jgi:hypothetical protein
MTTLQELDALREQLRERLAAVRTAAAAVTPAEIDAFCERLRASIPDVASVTVRPRHLDAEVFYWAIRVVPSVGEGLHGEHWECSLSPEVHNRIVEVWADERRREARRQRRQQRMARESAR